MQGLCNGYAKFSKGNFFSRTEVMDWDKFLCRFPLSTYLKHFPSESDDPDIVLYFYFMTSQRVYSRGQYFAIFGAGEREKAIAGYDPESFSLSIPSTIESSYIFGMSLRSHPRTFLHDLCLDSAHPRNLDPHS